MEINSSFILCWSSEGSDNRIEIFHIDSCDFSILRCFYIKNKLSELNFICFDARIESPLSNNNLSKFFCCFSAF
jgi:hypothetical protein